MVPLYSVPRYTLILCILVSLDDSVTSLEDMGTQRLSLWRHAMTLSLVKSDAPKLLSSIWESDRMRKKRNRSGKQDAPVHRTSV